LRSGETRLGLWDPIWTKRRVLEVLLQGIVNFFAKFCQSVPDWLFAPLPFFFVQAVKSKHPSVLDAEILVINPYYNISFRQYATLREIGKDILAVLTVQIKVIPLQIICRGISESQPLAIFQPFNGRKSSLGR